MVFLWGVIRCPTSNDQEQSRLLGMDWLTNSTHMDKLNCMFVHGSKLLDPNLAASSLATTMIYTILLWLIMQKVCATETLWLQTYNGQLQHNSRASHLCWSCLLWIWSCGEKQRNMGAMCGHGKGTFLHRKCLTCNLQPCNCRAGSEAF